LRRIGLTVAAGVATIVVVCASAVMLGPPAGSAPVVGRAASSTNEALNGVSCTSSTACFAVGEYFANRVPDKTLIERWNGTAWSIVPSANPIGGGVLNAVSCTSATFCMAVGVHRLTKTSYSSAVAERWNGKTWSIVAIPGAVHHDLLSVSCTSATYCFAVGDVVARWNGAKWSMVKAPNTWSRTGVSCASATACIAVSDPASAMRWNGKAWSTMLTPQPTNPAFEGFGLAGVSCPAATTCFAVGVDAVPSDDFNVLLENWNGKHWSRVANAGGDYFNAVSCASPTSCVAVGENGITSTNEPGLMAQRWDGTAWTEALPTPAADYGDFNGVSCTTPTDCFAVGFSQQIIPGPVPILAPSKTLTERWNGTTWSVVASP
jgi:hypothetical protein